MKLPGQGYKTGVSRLATIDPGVHLSEVKPMLAMLGAVGNLAQEYQAKETKRQTQEATMRVHEDQIAFQKEYGGKLEFDAMDPSSMYNPAFIDSVQEAGVTDVNQQIPAYRIMPGLTAKTFKSSYTNHGSIIKDKTAREAWLAGQENFGHKQYMGDIAAAQVKQNEYIDLQAVKYVEKSLADEDYGGARFSVLTSQLPQDRQDDLIAGINKIEATDFLNKSLGSENIMEVEAGLARLMGDASGNVPFLSVQETSKWGDTLQRKIEGLELDAKQKQAEIDKIQKSTERSMVNQIFMTGTTADKNRAITDLRNPRSKTYSALDSDEKRFFSQLLEGDVNGDITEDNRAYFNAILMDRNATSLDMTTAQDLITDQDGMFKDMSETDKWTYYTRLEAKRRQMLSGNADAANADRKLMVDDTKIMVENYMGGRPVDIPMWNNNRDTLRITHPVLTRTMDWTEELYPTINKIILDRNDMDQDIAVNEWRKAIDRDPSPMNLWAYDQLKTAVEKNRVERGNDTPGWGRKIGKTNPPPVSYIPGELAPSLAAQLPSVISLQKQYGNFTGILSKPDMNIFMSQLENADDPKELIRAAQVGLGEYAPSLFEQMKDYGDAGAIATVADLMEQGDEFNSDIILRGMKMMKEPATVVFMRDNKDEIDTKLIDIYGSVFGADDKRRQGAITASRAHMAVSHNIDASIQAITGGIITVDGRAVMNPDPKNLTGQSYTNWKNNLPISWYKRPENQILGWSDIQFKDAQENGEFEQVGLGRGSSYLRHPKSGYLMKRGSSKQRYIFNYDPNVKSFTQLQADSAKAYDIVQDALDAEMGSLTPEWLQDVGRFIGKFPGKKTEGPVFPKM